MSLFTELIRRNVLRMAVAYLAGAWLLTEVSATLFSIYGLPDAAARLVVTLLVIGFPIMLVLTWVYKLTPEGLRLDKGYDRSGPAPPGSTKRLDRAIMVLLALGLGYFAFDKFVLEPRREASLKQENLAAVEQARQEGRTEALVESYGDKSIAVLAFDDMSPNQDQEYLSDGVAEELLNLLARVPQLRVISRASAFSFKGQNLEIPEIAKRLNVANILEGSVRMAGNRVRITAQLIDARSDTQLWSETYDRTLDDVFAIQDEIAAMVVGQLKVKLLGETPHVKETDPEAYALYLQARQLGGQLTPKSLEHSNTLYAQVLAIDPSYAAAWNGLAKNYTNQAGNGLLPREEGVAQAREAVEKALAIDPDYAPAHASLGWIAETYDNDLAADARHLGRALQLDTSNLDILSSAANLLVSLGRLDQAIAVNEKVANRDPLNPISHSNLGVCFVYAGRWDEAVASFEATLRLSPGFIGAHYFMGTALSFKDEPEGALEAFEQEEDEEYRVKGQALALHALDRPQEAATKLQELIERWGDQWPSEVAQVYAWMGDPDAAFKWLDRAVAQKEDGLNTQFLVPYYRSLHADQRWAAFLERVRSSPEDLDAIEFEVTLPK